MLIRPWSSQCLQWSSSSLFDATTDALEAGGGICSPSASKTGLQDIELAFTFCTHMSPPSWTILENWLYFSRCRSHIWTEIFSPQCLLRGSITSAAFVRACKVFHNAWLLHACLFNSTWWCADLLGLWLYVLPDLALQLQRTNLWLLGFHLNFSGEVFWDCLGCLYITTSQHWRNFILKPLSLVELAARLSLCTECF